MPNPAITQATVFAALDQIVENGYVSDFDLSGKNIYEVDPRRILVDLNRCDADFDDLSEPRDEELVLRFISDWQRSRRPTEGRLST